MQTNHEVRDRVAALGHAECNDDSVHKLLGHDRKFSLALLVNDLARDLIYFNERIELDTKSTGDIFTGGIKPRLEEARNAYATLLQISRKP